MCTLAIILFAEITPCTSSIKHEKTCIFYKVKQQQFNSIVHSCLFLWLLFLVSCGKQPNKFEVENFAPLEIIAQGYVVPEDKLKEPVEIAAGQPALVPVRATEYSAVPSNSRPMRQPKVIRVGPPRKCTPGRESCSFPESKPAIYRTFAAGTPKMETARTAGAKDQNPHSFSLFGKQQGLDQSTIYCLLEDKSDNLWFGTFSGASKYDGKSFTHFTEKEGLSRNYVRAMVEDKQGNLWFATEGGGVSKYDGKYFTNFTTSEGLVSNNVRCIIEDAHGNIWFGTRGGVSKFDGKSFTNFTKREGLSDDIVWSMLEDRKGHLWFGTRDQGVMRYDGKSFTYFTEKEGLIGNSVQTIREDRNGSLWFGTSVGVCKYDGNFFTCYSKAEGLIGDDVQFISEDSKGSLWFGTTDGISRFDGQSFTNFSTQDGLGNEYVRSMLEDRRSNLWFGTFWGLNKYDGELFTHFTQKEGLSNSIVWSILEDKKGDIWLGTRGGGLIKFDGKAFVHFTANQLLRDNNYNNVYFIFEDNKGNLWFSTLLGGISKFDGEYFTHFSEKEGFKNTFDILTIFEDSAGNIWFGTRGGGVIKYDYKSFIRFTTEQGLSDNYIFSIQEDRQGNLWFGSWGGGITKYDPAKAGMAGSFTHFTTQEGLSSDIIWSILEDKQGYLWFASGGGGVIRFDGKSFLQLTEREGLCNNDVQSILEDKNGTLWFGTSRGLSRLAKNYEEKLATIRNHSNTDWKRDHMTVLFKNFTYEDGFSGIGCNRNAICEDKNGMIWIGANDRLTVLNPYKVLADTLPPNMQITGITLFNEPVDWRQLAHHRDTSVLLGNGVRIQNFQFDDLTRWYGLPERLSLAYDNNYLTFQFTGITTESPEKVKYQYILEGLDENWSAWSSRTEAPYGNLTPGTYTFRIKAKNGEGYWSKEASYTFTIRPPWWKTWWAYSGYGSIFLICLYLLRRAELRKQQAKLKLEQEKRAQADRLNAELRRVDELKDQFLANTSHELRTPLQGIIGLSESLIERVEPPDQKEDLAMIISSGKRLNSLVNDILDFSKLRNADLTLNRRPVSLHAVADIVLRNLTPLTAGKPLELINAVPADLPAVDGDENRLQQVLFNLVGNAIKFTEKGFVRVGTVDHLGQSVNNETRQRWNSGTHTFFVEDTGIGIPPDKREAIFQEFVQGDASTTRQFAGTGLGLSVSKKLVELHGGSMWVESEPGKGSIFYFTLPATAEAPAGLQATGSPLAGRLSAGTPVSLPGPSPVAVATNGDTVHVLIVDDEPVNQQVLRHHLASDNFRLTQAMTGEDALRALDRFPPSGPGGIDLVLLDVMMPRMSGYEVCEKIREKYLPSELPVIMITAKNQVQDLVQGLSLGANDYLAKPFTKEEFLARVRTQLDLHRIFAVTERFVPNEFLRALGRERITDVVLGDQIQREVTVLFSDIRDYTALSETMTPEENFRFVNAFHGRMGPIIRRHGGFVNQYLGDAIMAIFPASPLAALRAAVAMQRELAVYNEQRIASGRAPIAMGIGLHTGPLVMGIIGDAHRLDAATIADTVNTASRIESLTKHYGVRILLSEDVLSKSEVGSWKSETGSYSPQASAAERSSASESTSTVPSDLRAIAGQRFSEDGPISDFRYLGLAQVKGRRQPVGVYECFAGDAPDLRDPKGNTRDQFAEGLRVFHSREFSAAAAIFSQILQRCPGDQPARHYLTLSAKYMAEGVPADWTGVEVMREK